MINENPALLGRPALGPKLAGRRSSPVARPVNSSETGLPGFLLQFSADLL